MHLITMSTYIQESNSTCRHCGGNKRLQASKESPAEVRTGIWERASLEQNGFVIDGVWCEKCGTLFHPASVF